MVVLLGHLTAENINTTTLQPVNPTPIFKCGQRAFYWVKLGNITSGLEVKAVVKDVASGKAVLSLLFNVPPPQSQGFSVWDWYVVYFWMDNLPCNSNLQIDLVLDGAWKARTQFSIASSGTVQPPAPSQPAPTTPAPSEVGTIQNPYVFGISGNAAFLSSVKNNPSALSKGVVKADYFLSKFGYRLISTGWNTQDYGDGTKKGTEYQISFHKVGTEPISATFIILIGVVALALIAFVVWQLKFVVRTFYDGRIILKREDTNQAWIDGNKAVLQDKNSSDVDKDAAAKNLTGNVPAPSQPAPTTPPKEGGFLDGLLGGGTGALVALAAVYLFTKDKG